MKKSLNEIKMEFQAARIEMLPEFILNYQSDERTGVRNLVKRAEKQMEALKKEDLRLEQMHFYEKKYQAYSCIAGIDEAGRGPLAGPVSAAAVILPEDCRILYLNDSKKLSEKLREQLFDEIMEKAVSVGVGLVSHKRIDEINILQATYEAMREAVSQLDPEPELLLNDAVTIPGIRILQAPIIKGDAKSVSIAAASVIAKVTRDRLMREYDKMYPEYGFEKNKGYGSKEHIEALKRYGLSEIHRRTFTKNFLTDAQGETDRR